MSFAVCTDPNPEICLLALDSNLQSNHCDVIFTDSVSNVKSRIKLYGQWAHNGKNSSANNTDVTDCISIETKFINYLAYLFKSILPCIIY